MDSVALGLRAKSLLADETFHAVLESLALDCVKRWRESGALQNEEREKIYSYLRALDMVKLELERMGNTATMAAANAAQEQRDRQFIQRNVISPV